MKLYGWKRTSKKIAGESNNKIKRLLLMAKASWLVDYSLSKRYSRTSTCISSSRSILQIIARALL